MLNLNKYKVFRLQGVNEENLLTHSANLSLWEYPFQAVITQIDQLNPLTGQNGFSRIEDNAEEFYHGVGTALPYLDFEPYNQPLVDGYFTFYAILKKNTARYAALDLLVFAGDTWCVFDFDTGEIIEMMTTEDPENVLEMKSKVVARDDGSFLISFTVKGNSGIYKLNEMGFYVLNAQGALGSALSIYYPGEGENFDVLGVGLALGEETPEFFLTEDQPNLPNPDPVKKTLVDLGIEITGFLDRATPEFAAMNDGEFGKVFRLFSDDVDLNIKIADRLVDEETQEFLNVSGVSKFNRGSRRILEIVANLPHD